MPVLPGDLSTATYPYCRGRIFSRRQTDNGQYESICPVFWATGAALMICQTDWKNSGGLDKRFFAHMEEIDLCGDCVPADAKSFVFLKALPTMWAEVHSMPEIQEKLF